MPLSHSQHPSGARVLHTAVVYMNYCEKKLCILVVCQFLDPQLSLAVQAYPKTALSTIFSRMHTSVLAYNIAN